MAAHDHDAACEAKGEHTGYEQEVTEKKRMTPEESSMRRRLYLAERMHQSGEAKVTITDPRIVAGREAEDPDRVVSVPSGCTVAGVFVDYRLGKDGEVGDPYCECAEWAIGRRPCVHVLAADIAVEKRLQELGLRY